MNQAPESEPGPTGFLVALAILALALQFVLVLFAPGCATPPKPTPVVPAGTPACKVAPELDPDRICRGLFTKSGAPCVSCGGAAGCFDSASGVYCVVGRCLDDLECQYERADVFP